MSETNLRACPHFLNAFSDFIDGRLHPDAEAYIHAHLDCCEGCLRHLRAYRQGVAAYRKLDLEVDDDFERRLEASLWGANDHAVAASSRRRERTREGRRFGAPAAMALVAAVAFAFFLGLGVGERGRAPTQAGADSPVSFASVVPVPPELGAPPQPAAPRVDTAEGAATTLAGDAGARSRRNALRGRHVRVAEDLEREFAFQAVRLQDAWSAASGLLVRPAILRSDAPVTLTSVPIDGLGPRVMPATWMRQIQTRRR